MNIAIFGKRSFLAAALKRFLENQGVQVFLVSSADVIGLESRELEKLIDNMKVNYAFNCIAITNVDQAETNQNEAVLVNKTFVKNFAIACHHLGIKGIHYSTDYVFDGEKNAPYTEWDQPNPINFYGKTKLAGEVEFLKSHPIGLIIRVSWLFGPGKTNFIENFFEQLIQHKKIRVIDDQVGSPSFVDDVAEFSYLLKDFQGIFHLANQGFSTKKECAQFIAEELTKKEIATNPEDIIGVSLENLQLVAKRPKFSALNCDKAWKILHKSTPNFKNAITRYMNYYLKEKSYE